MIIIINIFITSDTIIIIIIIIAVVVVVVTIVISLVPPPAVRCAAVHLLIWCLSDIRPVPPPLQAVTGDRLRNPGKNQSAVDPTTSSRTVQPGGPDRSFKHYIPPLTWINRSGDSQRWAQGEWSKRPGAQWVRTEAVLDPRRPETLTAN